MYSIYMKVVELRDLQREEGHIFYIRKYSAEIFVELPSSIEHKKINFSIEMNPLGNKEVKLLCMPQINYPTIPLKKAIIEFILLQDSEGKLPC